MRSLIVLVQLTLVMHATSKPILENHTGHAHGGSMDNVFGKEDLQNITLGFMVGLPQNKKTYRSPIINPRPPQRKGKHDIAEFQNEERIRLLKLLLTLDTAGASIAEFQAHERARLHSFQDQERVRFQVEQQAFRSFQEHEKERLLKLARSLGTVGQSLESFQDQEKSRLQEELQAFASFQDQEKLRLQSLARALEAMHTNANLTKTATEVMTADHSLEGPPGQSSELLGQTTLDVTSIGAMALISILIGSGVTCAVLRCRRKLSAPGEEPLLV